MSMKQGCLTPLSQRPAFGDSKARQDLWLRQSYLLGASGVEERRWGRILRLEIASKMIRDYQLRQDPDGMIRSAREAA